MKTKLLLSTVLGCGLLVSSLPAVAQGSGNGQSAHKYSAQFTLTATPDAPQGAKGRAVVQSETSDDTETGTVSLQLQGLDPGDYAVSGLRASDGSTVDLGTATVEEGGRGRGRNATVLELPVDVDAADLTQIAVSSEGTALLVGDLADASGKSKATLNATVPLIAGEAAPDATGTARLKSSVKKGTVKNNFVLNASGVPADSTFTVLVDDVEADTVTSNRKGKVMVKKLPEGITSIGVVRLVDELGGEVVRAEF